MGKQLRREHLMVDTFMELADTLSSDYDVAALLQFLVARCAQILGADTAGVLNESEHDELRLAAAAISPEMEESSVWSSQRDGARAWRPSTSRCRWSPRTLLPSGIAGRPPESLVV